MKNNQTEKDIISIYEQKDTVITEILSLLKNNYIPTIKNLCKENKDIQLKMLNIKTEILKLDDKLDDILTLINTKEINNSKKVIAQFLNMINEEKTAFSIINSNTLYKLKEEYNDNRDMRLQVEKNISQRRYNENPQFYNQQAEEYEIWEKEQIKEQEEWQRECNIHNNYSADERQKILEEEQQCKKDIEQWIEEEENKNFNMILNEYKAFMRLEEVSTEDKNFQEYYDLRKTSIISTRCKNGKIRIYSQYKINGKIDNDPFVYGYPDKLSKRQLPTKVFEYLISGNVIEEKDFSKFSKNQFGRTFESKMGDIITEKELPQEEGRKKRYNKIDFSIYKKSKYQGVLYISNQWDENSITKFIIYINENYGDYIKISNPAMDFLEEIKNQKGTIPQKLNNMFK